MRGIPANIEDITTRRRNYTNMLKFVSDFADSDALCLEVIEYTHKAPRYCCTSLRQAAMKLKKPHIHAAYSGTRVWIYKEF